jgi:hypothetical protein
MSSPKATAKSTAPRRAAKPAPRLSPRAAKPKPAGAGIALEANRLAAAIERELGAGHDPLPPEALQRLMAALCNAYSAQVEAGGRFTPVPERGAVPPTAIMVTASGLLRAANLAVFELGMWQSWTGR